MFGKYDHFLNDFDVILALIKAIGILFFFAFKIRFGQISESTRNILFGFHRFKNLSIKNGTSNGKNLCSIFSNFFNSFVAKFPELRVTVVIKNSSFLLRFNSLILANTLYSPTLAA